MTLLLIDGDIIAYKACATAETPINWGDGLWTLRCFENEVSAILDDQIGKLVDEAPVNDCIVALSDKENYRKKLAPYYKANRADVRKPMLLGWARDYISSKYNTIIYRGLEADDGMGVLGTSSPDASVWTEDEELLTMPAKH